MSWVLSTLIILFNSCILHKKNNGVIISAKQKKITLMSKNNLSYTSLSCPKCKYLFPTVKHLPDYNDAKYEGNTAM